VSRSGESEAGDVLLSLSTELMSFNFFDTFVGPFDVANKVIEMVMLRMGIDVCCVSMAERERVLGADRNNRSV
jgi:hypothetical protein